MPRALEFRLCIIFGCVQSQRPNHAEENFRVVHDAIEIVRTGTFGVEDHVVGGVYFRRFIAGDVSRVKFAARFRVGDSLAIDCKCGRYRRRFEFIIDIRVRVIGVLYGERYVGVGIFRVAVAVFILEGREPRILVSAHAVSARLAVVFMICSRDARAVRVIGDNNDQRVVVLLGEFSGDADRLVEFDGIVRRSLPIHRVKLLVDGSAFRHQEKAVWVFLQRVNGFFRHIRQSGLIIEPLKDLGSFLHSAIDINVQIVQMIKSKQFRRVLRRRVQFAFRAGVLIAQRLKAVDKVDIVLALGARRPPRQEMTRSAAQNHVGAMGWIKHRFRDKVLLAAFSGMRDHSRGCRVGDVRGGYETDRHIARA